MIKRQLLLLSLLLLFGGILFAQKNQEIEEIQVTAEAFEGDLKGVVGGISVLSEENFSLQDQISLPAFLNTVPGVFMHSGTYSTNRIVIRGIGSRTPYSSNRIRAYFNDIPLTNGDGVTTLEDIDVETVGRLEVLKGPVSALYGSGLGGTIRLLSKEPQDMIRASGRYGSYNSMKYSLTGNVAIGGANVVGAVTRTQTDGYRQNSQYEKNSFLLVAGRDYETTSLRFTLLGKSLSAQIPSSVNWDTFQNSPWEAAGNWLEAKGYEENSKLTGGLTVTHRFSRELQNKTTLFAGLSNAFEHRPFNDLTDKESNYGVRTQFRYNLDKLRLNTGLELFTEQYLWKTTSEDQSVVYNDINESRRYYNAYVHGVYQLSERLDLSGAVNINQLHYHYSGRNTNYEKYTYEPILSPRMGANYSLNKSHNFFTSLGHGFSSPSLEETLRPDGQKNPDIKHEKGWMFELGWRFLNQPGWFYLEATAYSIQVKDMLITKRISEEIFTGVNAGKTSHNGIELQSFVQLLNTNTFPGKLDLTLAVTASVNKFRDFTDDGVDYSGNVLPGVPGQTFNTQLLWQPIERIDISLVNSYVGEQQLTDGNDLSYGPYQVSDMKVSSRFPLFAISGRPYKSELTIEGGVKNIFDQHYASMLLINAPSFGGSVPRYYYPGLPRNYYMTLSLVF